VADFIVVAVYLVGVTVLGLIALRWVRNMSDFIMPRRFGKMMLIMYAYGTGTHSDQAVGVASKTFTNGLSGIWYQWVALFPTPFYWPIAAMLRRFRALTMGDVFEARFSRSVAMLYAVFGVAVLSLTMGLMLKGSGGVITGATHGNVSANYAILVMTIMFVIYGTAGGLAAAVLTDFFQGILTIVFSFMLLPSILHATGGLAGLHRSITNPEMFSLVAPKDIGLFYIVTVALGTLLGIPTQPHTMGNCAAGRSELDGSVGFMGGSFIKRFSTVAWCLTGLAAVVYFAGQDIKPDNIYGASAAAFLPKIAPGMVGLFLSCLLASVMSGCSSFMIASSALFTENLYKRLAPVRSDRHYMWVTRIAAVVVVAAGLCIAYSLPTVPRGLEVFWEIATIMGIPFWLGLWWRRATPAGAWATMLSGLAAFCLFLQPWFVHFLQPLSWAKALRLVFDNGHRVEIYMPWRMVTYMGSVLAGIVVSLLTKPMDPQKLENFYALVRTPVRPNEPPPSGPCRLPEGVMPAPRRLLLPFGSLEILVPSRVTIFGLLVGTVLVVGIIVMFVWIVR
jgi:Na+/proline symporter